MRSREKFLNLRPGNDMKPRDIVGANLVFALIFSTLVFASCARENTEQKGSAGGLDAKEDMILIPAGEFIMGSDTVEIKEEPLRPLEPLFKAEKPRHKVLLKAFYIDKYETTNLKYKKFVDTTKRKPPATWKDGMYSGGRDNNPVTMVAWQDADEYCRWAGKRLPTEAEWEKAARGGDERQFPWGNEFDGSRANTEESKLDDTVPVGGYESGKSPYGVYDMVGNVWEWTADWYRPYPGNKEENEFFGDAFKVARGGAHGTSGGHYIIQQLYRTSFRFFFYPDKSYTDVGFRCAKDG
ncbi:MAG TPA: formylglycine-generating enzyme family protein [Nitrospiria bacterium]|nr:formylglycine-generating enzyme family protein [Nitrospiria bacterium]